MTNYEAAKKAYLEYYQKDEDFKRSGNLVEYRPFVVESYNTFRQALAALTPEERMRLKREMSNKKL